MMDLRRFFQAAPRQSPRRKRAAQARYDAAGPGFLAASRRVSQTAPLGAPIHDVAQIRAMSRHMARNDALGRRAIDAIVRGAVGRGIAFRATDSSGRGADLLQALLDRHLLTTDIDASGRDNIYGIQRLVLREIVEGGEVIVRRRIRAAGENLSLPTQLEVLPAEYINEAVDGALPNRNTVISGIEFDLRGRRVAYHLHPTHPHDTRRITTGGLAGGSLRIAAEDVLHVFRCDRAGQPRGVPWMAPVLSRMQEYKDFCEAVLVRQRIAAQYTAFIRNPSEGPAIDADEELDDGSLGLYLQAGALQELAPGQDITFTDLPKTDGADSAIRNYKHDIAAGLSLSYAVLTGDYSQSNYSSSRMGWIEHSRMIEETQHQLMIGGFLGQLSRWLLASPSVTAFAPDAVIRWTPPSREMIDPTKERAAQIAAIEAGLASRRGILAKEGVDVAVLDEERREDLEREVAFGIKSAQQPTQSGE